MAREESLDQCLKRDLGRVIVHLHRFRVTSFAATYFFVIGICVGAASIAGNGVTNADQALKHNFCVPKATLSKSRNGFIDGRFLMNACEDFCLTVLCLRAACKKDDRNECCNEC